MARSRALPLLTVALALGAAGLLLFWWKRPAGGPLAAPHAGAEVEQVRPMSSRVDSEGERAQLAAADQGQGPQRISETDPAGAKDVPSPVAALNVVLYANGRPATQGRVGVKRVSESQPRWQNLDPASGSASFNDLGPGIYQLTLYDLPPGWFAPGRPVRGESSRPAGRQIEMTGEDRTVRIDLEQVAHVSGFVRTPDGALARSIAFGEVRSLRVRFTSADPDEPGRQARSADVVDGRYEAELPIGLWIATVDGTPLSAEPYEALALTAPVPAVVKLASGSSAQLDLVFRELGTSALVVRILDEEGKPFGGLGAFVEEQNEFADPSTGASRTWGFGGAGARGVSDAASGELRLERLVPGRYRLWVEPEGFHPRGQPGTSKLGELPPTPLVDVARGGSTLELRIRRPHPVHVTGTVEVDSEWARSTGADPLRTRIELVWETGREEYPVSRDELSSDGGRFECWIEASVLAPRIEAICGQETFRRSLSLVSDVTPVLLTIRIPR